MKKVAFLAMLCFVISGCGYSNWNVFNAPQTGNSGQSQTNKTNGDIQQNSSFDQGLVVIEEDMPKPSEVENPNKPEAKKDGKFHINTIVSTWGRPDQVRIDDFDQKNYIWQNCTGSGENKKCCERTLVTDEEGYVTNLREAINHCL